MQTYWEQAVKDYFKDENYRYRKSPLQDLEFHRKITEKKKLLTVNDPEIKTLIEKYAKNKPVKNKRKTKKKGK